MHYNILSLTVSTVFPCRSKIPYSLYYDAWRCVNSTELIPNNLPDRDCFEEYIQSLGITANTHVVVYDRIGTLPAWKSKRNTKPSFRTWWLFRVKTYYKLLATWATAPSSGIYLLRINATNKRPLLTYQTKLEF